MRISDWSSDVCSSDLQRKRGVALQTSFVRFVEQHGGNTGKLRVGLNAVREYALGDHFYPRRGRGLAVQPRAIADGAPHGFARKFGHAFGGGARCKAAGGEADDLAVAPRAARSEERRVGKEGVKTV